MDDLHLRGGNIRVDYSGMCLYLQDDEQISYQRKCEIVRGQRRCMDLTACAKIVQPSQGCCPICGQF
jgi:hypothetical protein